MNPEMATTSGRGVDRSNSSRSIRDESPKKEHGVHKLPVLKIHHLTLITRRDKYDYRYASNVSSSFQRRFLPIGRARGRGRAQGHPCFGVLGGEAMQKRMIAGLGLVLGLAANGAGGCSSSSSSPSPTDAASTEEAGTDTGGPETSSMVEAAAPDGGDAVAPEAAAGDGGDAAPMDAGGDAGDGAGGDGAGGDGAVGDAE
jgi:hypothetical protein